MTIKKWPAGVDTAFTACLGQRRQGGSFHFMSLALDNSGEKLSQLVDGLVPITNCVAKTAGHHGAFASQVAQEDDANQ